MLSRILKLLGLCGLVACCVSVMLILPDTASAQGYCVNGVCYRNGAGPGQSYANSGGGGMNQWRVGLDYGATIGIGGYYGNPNSGGRQQAANCAVPASYQQQYQAAPAMITYAAYESPPVFSTTTYTVSDPVYVVEGPPVVTSYSAHPAYAAYRTPYVGSSRASAAYRAGYRAGRGGGEVCGCGCAACRCRP